jgi:hypothetical protein
VTTGSGVTTTLKQRKLVREYVGNASSTQPVIVVPGDQPPHWRGESYRWETRTGILVRHPTAYARVGWSSMIYIRSTLCLCVGATWLAHAGDLPPTQASASDTHEVEE